MRIGISISDSGKESRSFEEEVCAFTIMVKARLKNKKAVLIAVIRAVVPK